MRKIGVVIIGRNEGDRLKACLSSLAGEAPIVYVDSGSTDGSVEVAGANNAEVVLLDTDRPFTAARARNAGIERLRQIGGCEFVQFVDGDCEVADGWIDAARRFLEGHENYAVVCGRRREKHPEHSVYNAHCDREWNTPVGDAKACGGDAMMRFGVLAQAGDYRADLIAGEEPELCVRIRKNGWRVMRLGADMTWHDAKILHFSQYWQRSKRAGFAFAEGAFLHGKPPERHFVDQTRSALFWGGGLPLLMGVFSVLSRWGIVALILVYAVQILRIAAKSDPTRASFENAVLLVVGKFPEALGATTYYLRRNFGRTTDIIEYK